ncbi:hypothetical protein GCM10009619_08680 [Williamsia maris]|uniref:Uncharacterized protein n=2 Tax=Williamsia maris TaxID=72806 RepID=A0ABT1H9V8_9NOCA|nr:hypothetical protein [Williamsia maris]
MYDMASVTDPERDEPADEPTPSRTKRVWTYGLIAVSVIAVAVVIVGLLLPGPESELTTAPPSSSDVPSSAAAPTENRVVDEPFDPKAPIPGCDTVEVPDTGDGKITSSFTTGEPSYDNPRFPWFTGPKATAMSDALRQLLPAGAELQFATESQSLVFQPITDFGDPDPMGSTNAYGSVTNGDARGSLQVVVQKTSAKVPPCVAGQLDARRVLSDATVVDVHDTWQEINGVRTNRRSAYAYAGDGSWIQAIADDAYGDNKKQNSGKIPLAIDDLVRMAGDPGLRVSTAVPAGTPAPRDECLAYYGGADGPEVTREQAARLDRVLATIDFRDRRPPPLQISGSTNNGLCTTVPAAGSLPRLDISIAGGQSPPAQERPDPTSGERTSIRRLGDGTVISMSRSFYSTAPIDDPGAAQSEMSTTVIVTRPNGNQVAVVSRSSFAPALPPAELEEIALTPGLEL